MRETSKDGADGSNFEWADGYNTRFGVTYLDYKDEQRRYPKASANFIKSWFDAHISKPNPGSSDVDEIEVEDTTSEISTDGQSPITRVETTPITSEGAITPEHEEEVSAKRGIGAVKGVVD